MSVESRARGDALAVRCPLALEPERPRFSPQQRLALNLLRSGAAAAPSGGGAEAERLLEVLVGATDTAAVRALVQAVSACAGSVDACGAAARAAAAALDDASDARVGAGFRRLGLAPVVTLARLGDGCQQVFGGFTPAATQALRAVLCTRAGRKDEAVAAGRRLAGLDPGDFLRRSWFDGVVGGDGAAAGDEATDAVAAGNVVGASTADREEGRSDAG